MIKKILYFIIKVLPAYLVSILFAVWPFLVIEKEMNVFSPKLSVLFPGKYVNFFTYYRLLFWGILTVILLFIFLLYFIIIKPKVKINKNYIFLFLLLYWIFLSTLLSPYIEAFTGMYDRTRGLFAFCIGFIYIFLISILIKNYRQKKIIFFGFIFSTFFLTLLSLFQFFNIDLFLKFPLKYITFKNPDRIIDKSSDFITFAGFFNKNVLGAFQAISLTFFSIIFLRIKKRLFIFIVLFLFILLIFFSLISTSTRGAWVAYILSLLLYIIFNKKNNYIRILILFCSYILAFLLINHFSGNIFTKPIRDTFIICIIMFILIFIILFIQKLIKLKIQPFFLLFILIISSIIIVSYITPYKDNPKIMKLGSGRVYIYWKISEIILKNPAFGIGQDTTLFNLNVEDIYRYKYLRREYIDKAHSMYLGLASESGLPALVLFLLLSSFVLYKLFQKRENLIFNILLWSLVAYYIQGLFFDAFICTDIFIYTILGLTINHKSLKIN